MQGNRLGNRELRDTLPIFNKLKICWKWKDIDLKVIT